MDKSCGVLGFGWAAEIGASILPVKLFVTRSVGDTDEGVGHAAGFFGHSEEGREC